MSSTEQKVPTILAVDDDPAIRRVIDRSLRAEGYRTRTCVSAESALAALRGDDVVDLVLLDITMEGENGMQLARRIRAGEAGDVLKSIPIVFVTGETGSDLYEESFDVGAHRYITKPFHPDALIGAISELLHGS